MKNYRIKTETYGDITKYYPQERNMWTLWRWRYVFAFDVYFDGGYDCSYYGDYLQGYNDLLEHLKADLK